MFRLVTGGAKFGFIASLNHSLVFKKRRIYSHILLLISLYLKIVVFLIGISTEKNVSVPVNVLAL